MMEDQKPDITMAANILAFIQFDDNTPRDEVVVHFVFAIVE